MRIQCVIFDICFLVNIRVSSRHILCYPEINSEHHFILLLGNYLKLPVVIYFLSLFNIKQRLYQAGVSIIFLIYQHFEACYTGMEMN